jgi:hypothetical protein
MKRMRDEQETLEGKDGAARRKAMELPVSYAEALGAENFVDTCNVTLILGFLPDIGLVRRIVPSLDPDEIASRFFLDSDERVVGDRVKVDADRGVVEITKKERVEVSR